MGGKTYFLYLPTEIVSMSANALRDHVGRNARRESVVRVQPLVVDEARQRGGRSRRGSGVGCRQENTWLPTRWRRASALQFVLVTQYPQGASRKPPQTAGIQSRALLAKKHRVPTAFHSFSCAVALPARDAVCCLSLNLHHDLQLLTSMNLLGMRVLSQHQKCLRNVET